VAAQQAMKDAGLSYPIEGDPYRTSVIIGTGIGGLSTHDKQMRRMLRGGPKKISPFMVINTMPNAVAANISSQIGAHGESFTGNSACGSATQMMRIAYLMLRTGEYDVIVTGGSEAAITEFSVGGYSSSGVLTSKFNDEPQRASRPFDRDRSGFVIGEGAGVLIFETLEHALARDAHIYAEVLGSGATNDASHITHPCEDGTYAAMAIKIALEQAGITPDQVDYINAHGTSTKLNDISETLAIKQIFGEHARNLAVSSTKSMHGHVLGASGALEAIATLIGMEHGFIPPTINLDNPDPKCDLFYVPNVAIERSIIVALSESFGFGGHNSVLVFGKYRY